MKIMLDANTFDFIYENQLIDTINSLVNENKISLYTTHIQNDEIEKIPDLVKKESIKKIVCNQVNTSNAIIGTDEDNKRGFVGSRMDSCEIIDDDLAKLEKVKSELTKSHPLGNLADVSIAFTAMKKDMDYLVSNDDKISKISKALGSNVKTIKNSEFYEIIKNL